MVRSYINQNKGLTLIEIVVTLGILGIILLPLSSLFVQSAKINKQSEDKMQATYIAQRVTEALLVGKTKESVEKPKGYAVDVEIIEDENFQLDLGSGIADSQYETIITLDHNQEYPFGMIYGGGMKNRESISSEIRLPSSPAFQLHLQSKDRLMVETKDSLGGSVSVTSVILDTGAEPIKIRIEINAKERINASFEVKNSTEKELQIHVVKGFQQEGSILVIPQKGKIKIFQNIFSGNRSGVVTRLQQIRVKVSKGQVYEEKTKLIEMSTLRKLE